MKSSGSWAWKTAVFYCDRAEYSFLIVRLQTWFPYGLQIAINGREWLRRPLTKEGIEFVLHGNKFRLIRPVPV